jgi:anaerobic selenocysteine-containing dehydrogenase
MAGMAIKSGKIEVFIPELEEDVIALTPETEREALLMANEFPFVLNAGRHMKYNANTMMRNPEWNKGKRACTVCMNLEDAQKLGLTDQCSVKVITENGNVTGELEITEDVRIGTVLIPHGFGLVYNGETYGFNANELTKNTHRDPIGTPLHRYVPCRIEAA